MPQAVTHLLVPLVIGALIKDWYESRKGKYTFSLHYVLIAGLGGVLPDIDIGAYWILHFFGFSFNEVHKTFTHTLFVPLLFLILFFVFRGAREIRFGRHKLRLSIVFLMLTFGSFAHLVLDAVLGEQLRIFYPFLSFKIGIDLVSYFDEPLRSLAFPTLDGVLLVLWIVYLEWKHKISDFI